MIKKKGKKGIIGGFTITFVATVIIILILLSYFIFSFVVKEFSSVRSGIDSTKYKETNIGDYFYSNLNLQSGTVNEKSFQYLYIKKYSHNSQPIIGNGDIAVDNKKEEALNLINSIKVNCVDRNKPEFNCPYSSVVQK